jgi:hypothetical protein
MMIVVHLLTNKQGEAILMGGASRAMSVTFWPVKAAGSHSSTLRRPCRRIRIDKTKGWIRKAAQTVRNTAETTGTKCAVGAGSAVGRRPNPALQRIAARWQICLSRGQRLGSSR